MADRMLGIAELEDRIGVTRNTIYVEMREGRFPRPLQIGRRAVRWPESEIQAWLDDRPRSTGDLTRHTG